MAEIRASFFIECEELLEALQDGLQTMDDGTADSETINTVFRAVHSIKGGAGAFGLDTLVNFAHRFETALDEVRAGRLAAEGPALKLFFTGSDVLADLVRDSRDDQPHDESRIAEIGTGLDALIGDTNSANDGGEEEVVFQPMALSLDLDLGEEEPDTKSSWQIQFGPQSALYSSGNEPLYLIRALSDLGPVQVTCRDDDIPTLDALDPEAAHVSWCINLATDQPETAIRETFDFVDGLCRLEITEGEAAADPLSAPEIVSPVTIVETESSDAELTNTPSGPAEPPTRSATVPASPRATVRVELDRIDRLVNLVGEIVINQAMLAQSVEAAGIPPNSPVRTGLEEFLQLTRDIQDSVMMIRAQPVKSLFQRMNRIVREASAAIGKSVRLHTEGENTEVDKTVIERLADPLTHMIRNAVDHGLESEADRLAAGKSPNGNIYLRARHQSGRVLIEVADDGGGIDREKVLQKAIDRDLVPAESQLSDAEIDNLLFLPGFSTADEISSLSGRGVGMDVVRSAIQALGGRVSIVSERGKGTTFKISLPLTLAVLDGMVIRVAGETIVVPLNAILETQALGPTDIRALGPRSHVVNVRDRFVPLLDLGAELGYRAPLDDHADQVLLLIGQDDGTTLAVVVDSIEDQRQVVIKGLQDSYGRVPGIAAATILGDGQVALILDPGDLVARANGTTRSPGHDAIPDPNIATTGP